MPINPLFWEASTLAEKSLDFLISADHANALGRADRALECLRKVAALAGSDWSSALKDMQGPCAEVATRTLRRRGRLGTVDYTSAHDTVVSVWDLVSLLLQYRPDFCSCPAVDDWLGLDVPALHAALDQERVKLRRLGTPQDEDHDDIDRMRAAIAEKGADAKPMALIAEAKVRKERGRAALRELESKGEYHGFSRPRPARYKAR